MKQISSRNQIHVHIDADAFFASVEQVLHRKLKGKPVVVGQNGGIVSALSYPAKELGISRVSPILISYLCKSWGRSYSARLVRIIANIRREERRIKFNRWTRKQVWEIMYRISE